MLTKKKINRLVRLPAIMTSLAFALAGWLVLRQHFIVGAGSTPAGESALVSSELTPFIDIVPSQDGTALLISARNQTVLSGTVFANIGIGPGHQEGSYTMVESGGPQSYVATAAGFTPKVDSYAPLTFSTTTGLNSDPVEFYRAFVMAKATPTLNSRDGRLALSVVSTDTFPVDTYVVIAPSVAPPGPLPSGHQIVGQAFSIRAPATQLTTNRPMGLKMFYDGTMPGGSDPHWLALFEWNPATKQWENLSGRLAVSQKALSTATDRFATYALMASTTWRDEFDDLSGLAGITNTTTGLVNGDFTLTLSSVPGSGSAVSQLLSPTGSIAQWGIISYEIDSHAPPNATVRVDVLSDGGEVLLTDVASGSSLAAINPADFPMIKLRVTFISSSADVRPALKNWRVTWQADSYSIYLPFVTR